MNCMYPQLFIDLIFSSFRACFPLFLPENQLSLSISSEIISGIPNLSSDFSIPDTPPRAPLPIDTLPFEIYCSWRSPLQAGDRFQCENYRIVTYNLFSSTAISSLNLFSVATIIPRSFLCKQVGGGRRGVRLRALHPVLLSYPSSSLSSRSSEQKKLRSNMRVPKERTQNTFW